jgi:putative mRNA 3-end processing factor
VERQGVKVSLHPAGHVLGSAQVRVEYRGEVWVASGDYKTEADGTCAPFEPVPCDTFITESTFGLPIYRWPTQQALFTEINAWWQRNADEGRASVLFCYAFGKAQRILHGVDAGIGPVVVHGAVEPLNAVYRAAGVALPPTLRVTDGGVTPALLKRALVLAPPSAQGTPWMRRFGHYSDAFASGWMQLRGTRRRRGVDRGFVMSDHADWPGLQSAIAGTGAGRIMVTHGSVAVLVRWLSEMGLQAEGFKTEYGDEDVADQAAPEPLAPAGSTTGDETGSA